jgi:cAMP-dependent protein kinase regulator
VSEDTLRDEILALIEDTLNPVEESATPAIPSDEPPVADIPLFRSLKREELVALIGGLRLLAFEPGQIIVAEGESGASLFVLTSGLVRAYVRNAAQQQVQVRRLKEGDFFGEISVLSGGARTATITAASRCELLELDKTTLDRIAETHPHVREVLQQFHDQRKDNTLETLSRAVRIPGR